jgi:hypothetical protein
MKQKSNLKKMEKKIFRFLMVLFVITMLNAIAIGYSLISSYLDNYSQVEYASETDNKFYQKMIELERNQTLHFNGFPASLTSILFKDLKPGERILNCGDEPLTLVSKDLDRTNINRYYYYIIKDTKNNYWSLCRHNEKFRLNRIDEKRNKKWLKGLEDQIRTN